MLVRRIENATKVFGAPSDWKDDGSSCAGLPVKEVETDQGKFMVSAWEPTPEELKALNEGKSVQLWVRGEGHPVVALLVDLT
jgi:hypothetical protein